MDSNLTYPLVISIGAILGALSRYYLTLWTQANLGNRFPYATFFINLTGCFLIGFFFTLATTISQFPKALDLAIRIGFLGSYTTFSTYEWDTLNLWREKTRFLTVFYGIGTILLGVIAVFFGSFLANLLSSLTK
jgi:CrcB protein